MFGWNLGQFKNTVKVVAFPNKKVFLQLSYCSKYCFWAVLSYLRQKALGPTPIRA